MNKAPITRRALVELMGIGMIIRVSGVLARHRKQLMPMTKRLALCPCSSLDPIGRFQPSDVLCLQEPIPTSSTRLQPSKGMGYFFPCSPSSFPAPPAQIIDLQKKVWLP